LNRNFERWALPSIAREFVMNAIHSAVVAAIIITASLASNLLAIVTVGPARTTSFLRLRLGLRRSPQHVKRFVDCWVAGMLVRREQHAANWASQRLQERELHGTSRRDVRIKPGRPR
jgi:hypothetical protein